MITITYFGHNCFHITSDLSLLIDPFITGNPLAAGVDIHSIGADHILLTHGHGDHVADCEQLAVQNDCNVVAMVEVAAWFEKLGLATHGLNFGGTYVFSDRTRAKMVQAHHSSSMPDGSYGGNPGSFILTTGDKTIFIAGDTSLHYDMKMYGELIDFDLAILPIGGNYTMDAEDAAIAAGYLGVNQVIGCHYDSFPVIQIDHKQAQKCFTDKGIELHLLPIGQSMQL